MGTLKGTVNAEIELEPSVRGIADVVEKHMSSGKTFISITVTNVSIGSAVKLGRISRAIRSLAFTAWMPLSGKLVFLSFFI